MKITQETRERIIQMLHEGKPSEEIARALGVGKMQVAGIKAHLTLTNSEAPRKVGVREQLSGNPPSIEQTKDHAPSMWSSTPSPEEPTGEGKRTSILIGTDLIFKKKAYWNFHPTSGNINPHMLIIGETGSGKTYAAQCIIAELKKKGISTIIFDYGQGFGLEEASREFISSAKPRQIEASKNGITINPIQIFPDDVMGPVNAAQRVADTFCRIYPRIGIQQKEALVEAIENTFLSYNIKPDDNQTWDRPLPPFIQIHRMLRIIAESDDHPLKNPARSVYSHINSFFRFNVIRDGGENLRWREMIDDKPNAWVIQLKGLDHYVSMIITEMLLWNLISYLQSKGPSPIRTFIVLDEAHKLSFDNNTPVDWLLREGRKFGVGTILASQQLEDYSQVAISNTATKLVFQNTDEQYRLSKSLVKKCRNLNDYKDISEIITTLGRGNSFFVTENIGRLVKIDSMNERG